ncbi:methyl-accepting chemotaxis protein [Agaribacter flavus]|uniref:Methyl-accepting chemotaxis protein n=1 Tax=Agaribacter flavus TaxID=1902781 RepID=A0ABV7FP78_9ALTE
MKVNKIIILQAIIVSILMITPIIALKMVANKGSNAIQETNNVYSQLIVNLSEIDAALKNARFHGYAAFMHDETLEVSSYHTHPFELHSNVVRDEITTANQKWEVIFTYLEQSPRYANDINILKSHYDKYYSQGAALVNEALSQKDFDAIVRITTAVIPEYAQFSAEIQALIEKIKTEVIVAYEDSHQDIDNLTLGLILFYVAVMFLYVGFSYWFQRLISEPLDKAVQIVEKIASGNLSINSFAPRKDEFGFLFNAIEKMRKSLSDIVTTISVDSNMVEEFSVELKNSSRQLDHKLDLQVSALLEASGSLDELQKNLECVSDSSLKTSSKAVDAGDSCTDSIHHVKTTEDGILNVSKLMQSTKTRVSQLSEQVEQIGSVTDVIRDVAEQTNLLALNAAIEAARAGELGRGFAVVADEVRSLAERTTESVVQISAMIKTIQDHTIETVNSMNESYENTSHVVEKTEKTQESMKNIGQATELVSQLIKEVAESILKETKTSTELLNNIHETSRISKESKELVVGVAGASNKLADISKRLKTSTTGFTL